MEKQNVPVFTIGFILGVLSVFVWQNSREIANGPEEKVYNIFPAEEQ